MPLNLNPTPESHPDDALLEDARMAASSDWEVEFTEDLLDKREKYGMRFTLTDKQREKLTEIAEGGEGDLFSRQPGEARHRASRLPR